MHVRAIMLVAGTVCIGLLPSCGGGGGGDGGEFAGGIRASGDTAAVALRLEQSQIESGAVSLPAVLEHGRQLFAASFNELDGAGRPESTGTGGTRLRRTSPENFNRISGPDANSCGDCHNLPRLGGGGDNVANVFVLAQARPFVNFDGGEGDGPGSITLDTVGNERNTPGMWGAGYIELLAREMSTELIALRDTAVADTLLDGMPRTVSLQTKGIDFGSLQVDAMGMVDTALVEGLDSDLIVKPFHQKGVVVSLREFTNNAMNHHHGMQSAERFGSGVDADVDGLADELRSGDITAATLWQAILPVPGRTLPDDPVAAAAVQQGEALFMGAAGCAGCHTPSLSLNDPSFTEPNPFNPVGNLRPQDVTQVISIDLTQEGLEPRLSRETNGRVLVPAFTDLKRHDMGAELEEPLVQAGVGRRMFLTKKLWGFASEPPYMHHGRATTITEAILMHGGEADSSRSAFNALAQADKEALITFLRTLRVQPEGSTQITQTEVFGGPLGERGAKGATTTQDAINQGNLSSMELFARGEALFTASFNTLDGQGRPLSTGTGAPRALRVAPQNFNRVSGPDANACSGCHFQEGAGGGGGNVANVFVLAQARPFINFDMGEGDDFLDLSLSDAGNERNTPGMWGGGFIEMLSREMTAELQSQRDQAIQLATATQTSQTVQIGSKGVLFGTLQIDSQGQVDATGVEGVDADLIVKPWHQKGVVTSLREFTNNAMNHHHGMQSAERFGAGADPDGDGIADELSTGDITAATLFQVLLRVPGRRIPTGQGRQNSIVAGERLFNNEIIRGGLDCASCHRPDLVLNDPVYTEPNPYNPAGNLRVQDVPAPFSVDLTSSGPTPRLAAGPDGKVRVPAYTDLKRHDMGDALAEPLVQGGVSGRMFLTKRLWGFSNEPPYMHHGRAMTIDEAIRLHGGEAQASRDAYLSLTPTRRASVVDFLKTLQVVPEGSPLFLIGGN